MTKIKVKLSQFEGPLDLLLHLIEKAEMDIQDIRISEITAQYLSLMPQVDESSMDNASEFLSMAATLLYIKSRALLPRPVSVSTDENEPDPEQMLIQQIREYKIYKEAAELLANMHKEASQTFTRLPDEYPLPPPIVNIVEVSADKLLQALTKLLLKEEEKTRSSQTRELKRDDYTIGDCIEIIRQKLRNSAYRPIPFTSLFPRDGGRIGIIVTFMAMLELCSACELRIIQKSSFSPIELEALPSLSTISAS